MKIQEVIDEVNSPGAKSTKKNEKRYFGKIFFGNHWKRFL